MAERQPWVTYLVLAVVGLVAWRVTGFIPTEASLEAWWFSAEAAQAGEWYRLVTSVFAHGGILHLVFNAIAIASLASIERRVGSLTYAIVFLAAGVGGNLAHVLVSPTPVVGASGAIFGLLGLLLVLAPATRLFFFGLPVPAVILLPGYAAVVLLVPGFEQLAPIAHFAHLGGLLVGIAAGAGLAPRRAVEHLAYMLVAFGGVGLLVLNVQTVGLARLVDAVRLDGIVGLLELAWPSIAGLVLVAIVLQQLSHTEREEAEAGESLA